MRRAALRRILSAAVLVLVAAGPALGQSSEKRPIEAEDYYRVKRVGGTELSPDGRYLLYTVQRVRRSENDRITEVWWADLVSGKNRRLSTAGVNTTNPHWTPDGRRIYFTTKRGEERGIHFLDFLEPGGEAYKIPGVPASPYFAPDGTWILYSRSVPAGGEGTGSPGDRGARERGPRGSFPDGIPALTRRMGTEWAGRTEEERNRDVYVITHAVYKRDGRLEFIPPPARAEEDEEQPERFTQFFRMPADGLEEGEQAEQLTFDEWNKRFQSFSPDGRYILYTVNLSQKEEVDEEVPYSERPLPEIGIYLLPTDGAEAQQIYRERGMVSNVRMSPEGSRIAFTITVDRRKDPLVRIITVEGKMISEIGEGWVYGFRGLTWSADGTYLLSTAQIGGRTEVIRINSAAASIETVTGGRHSIGSVSFDRAVTKMAYVKDTAERPWEAFVAGIDGGDERQVSEVNDEWLGEVKLSRVERFTFEGARHNRKWLDKLPDKGPEYMMGREAPSGERPEIEAWLMYPLDYEEGGKYPLVLSIHGGPHSLYRETWFPEFQMLAAQGMFVLYINPRGSGGYGRNFSNMIMRAWGIDDYKDYMQALDIVIARGIVDEENLGVTGGSYGGFMTNWITAHNDRFKAAITARSIANWISFYGVSDASGLVESEFGGRPWPFESRKEGSYRLAMMLSPIVWADRVKTPTLIIHSINDYRTPLADGEAWFRALKKNKVPVKMVLFPDSYHGLSRTGEPWLLVRRLNEYIDWFKAYLVDDRPVVDAEGAIGGPGDERR